MTLKHYVLASFATAALLGMSSGHTATITIYGDGSLAAAQSGEEEFWGDAERETEDFESYEAGTQAIVFDSSVGRFVMVTAGSTGLCEPDCADGLVILDADSSPFNGRFDVTFADGSGQWLDSFDAREVQFIPEGDDVRQVGFFITDPNDAGGRFNIQLRDGTEILFDTTNAAFGGGLASGQVFYVGVMADQAIESIWIRSNNRNDGFGIDTVSVVPEPAVLGMLGAGLLGMAAMRRRRKAA